jgi:hypothetical protein
MIPFSAQIYNKDFSNILIQYSLDFRPTRLSWNAIGGPDDATIEASGPEVELWELIERLRSPIEVIGPSGSLIWWGYIEGVSVNTSALNISVFLERMSNRICVTYSEVNVAGTVGERRTTTWYEDADSIAAYGTKERRLSQSQATATEAENYAQTLLERMKFPIVKHTFSPGEPEATATIQCSGWWKTLDWKFYENSGGKEGYEEIGQGLQSLGDNSARQKMAQSFQIASGTTWEAQSVRIRMKKEESPVDNLTVGLYSDSAGAPGTLLASAQLAGSEVNENLNWHELLLNTRVLLAVSTTYWLVVSRSGATDATNYYKVDANEELGYTSGILRVWNGSAWVARSPDADMLFAVGGVEETTTQLERMFTIGGQFFTGVDVDILSGVYSSPYRDGDQSVLSCVKEILKSGTTNLRRILATVNFQRRIKIYEEPASGSNDYALHANGDLHDVLDRFLNRWNYPVGIWVRLADVIPASADTSRIADPSRVFIERVIYNVEQDSVVIQERDYIGLLEVE